MSKRMRKLRHVVRLLVLSLLGMLSLAGCWDNRSVDHRDLVLVMGISPSHKVKGDVAISFIAPTPDAMAITSSGGSSSTNFLVLRGRGKTLSDAFSSAQAQTPRDLYLGHLELVTFSTHLSASEMFRTLNALARIGTLDKTPYIASTAVPITDAVAKSTPQDKFPGLYYHRMFSCTKCQTVSYGIRFWQVIARLATPGVDLALPDIQPGPEGGVVDRLSLWRHDQYVATLPVNTSQILGLLQGRSHKLSFYLTHAQGADIRAVAGGSSIHTTVGSDGKVSAQINLSLTATLDGINTTTETASQLSEISRQASHLIALRSVATIRTLQKLNVDPLGIGRELSWQHPSRYGQLHHWHAIWPHVPVTVHVHIKVNKMGDVT